MGVLDELKKEAESIQTQRDQQESAGAAQRVELERKLVTRVDDLYCYFKEFQHQLNVVNPNVICSVVDVGDLCKLNNLTQKEYKIRTDDVREVRKFKFYYNCVGSGGREVKFPNYAVAEKKKELLLKNQLKFKLREEPGGRYSFFIEAFVPVSFHFAVDVDKAVVRLRVKNKPLLGVSNYSYSADKINSEFMDEVAKYILGKPNRFDELSGNTIPEDTLTDLRRQLTQVKDKKKPATANSDTGKKRLKGILTKPLFSKKP